MRWDLTSYPYKIQVVQMLTAANKQQMREFCQDFLQFVQQYPTPLDWLWFSDEVHFHLDLILNKQNDVLGLFEFHVELWKRHSILKNAPCGVQSACKCLLDQSFWRAP